MEAIDLTLSQKHAKVLNDNDFFNKKSRPISCVYLIDGLYVGATNDLKRRIREYIGRAKRDEKHGKETAIMAYIKQQIAGGHRVKFYILSLEVFDEKKYIQRYFSRGVKLLNDPTAQTYDVCYSYNGGFYEKQRILNGTNAW